MQHSLRVEVLTYGPLDREPLTTAFVQALDSEDFDPENRTVGALAQYGWDELVYKTYLGQTLKDANEEPHEDDRVAVFFDGDCILDEAVWHVAEAFDDAWAERHDAMVN